MPTRPQKAKKLLKQVKAKVVSVTPFTIQLKYATGETKQEIILGGEVGTNNNKLISRNDNWIHQEIA